MIYYLNSGIKILWNTQSSFKVMLLSRGYRVLGICTIGSGGTTATVLYPNLVFASGLKANPSSINEF